MTIQADLQIGLTKETVFGTVVTPAAFFEPVEEDLDYTITTVQGAGLRVGNRAPRSDRRAVVKYEPAGSFTVETLTKGNGKLFEAPMTSAGTSNLISGSAYQQQFSITSTDYLNSYTIQKGVPPLGGGTTLPHTFNGMVCSGFEFSMGNAEIPTLKFNWVGKGFDTSTGLAAASYPASMAELTFLHSSLTIGGSPTAPTTTALGTGGTAAANVREFSLTFDNNLDSNGWNIGGGGQRTRKPAVGLRNISGSLTAEFDAVTLRDLYLAQTGVPIVFTLQMTATTGTAISGAVYPALQFYIPVAFFEGEIPKGNAGDVITQSIDFTVLDNGTVSPLIVSIVTAETAI